MHEEFAGYVGVDAGIIWIGDPCYLSDSRAITDWGKWADEIIEKGVHDGDAPIMQNGGFVTPTLYGDGSYPVYVTRNSHGQITGLRIDFDPTYDEDED